MAPEVLVPEVEGDPAPWLRLPGEPHQEYSLFVKYLGLGERRSFAALAREVAEPALAEIGLAQEHPALARTTIRRASQMWRWNERAAAYDEYEAAEDIAAMRRGRLALRKKRRELLDRMADLLEKKVGALEGKEASLGDVTEALRLLMVESRKEYDDTPAERAIEKMAGGSGRPILATEVTALMMRIQSQVLSENGHEGG